MKNKLLLSNLRAIKSSYKTFISLMCISLLGVGFFVGIKTTAPDMIYTFDKYYDDLNVYDVKITSTVGFSDNNIEAIKEINDIKDIKLVNNKDEIIKANDKEYAVKFIEINDDINKIEITKGKKPKNKDEIVVEENLLKENNLTIGDYIEIGNQKFQIVGIVKSPLYFSVYRDSTTIGNGKIDYYAYTISNFFNESTSTDLYITVDDCKNLTTDSSEYNEKVNAVIKEIEKIKENEELERFNELKSFGLINDQSLVKWYVFSRDDNYAYSNFISSATNIKKIGNIFPLVFYVIAILISLISMTRMVEDDRSEVGTLKSLGFSNLKIVSKYLIYALSATIIGGIIGIFIGVNTLPVIVWDIYKVMFDLPSIIITYNFNYIVLGLAITTLCITIATIYSTYKMLKEEPANLMRPKAPKNGKRVLLERIGLIWNHLNFSNKISVRNIFRYKSRVMAMIFGITGCTALILAGFGLKDSIKDITDKQYNEIFKYNMIVTVNDKSTSNLKEQLSDNKDIDLIVLAKIDSVTISKNDKEYDVTTMISEDDNFNKLIKLKQTNSDKKITLKDDKIVISAKLAKLLNVKKGNKVNLKRNNKEYTFVVQEITENYFEHYVYMTKNTYEKYFEEFDNNSLLIKTNDLNEKEEQELQELINNLSYGANITNTNEIVDTLNDTIKSLDSVVFILIVSSAMLAFVVLYNLANINIIERKREIATLKVLGFYDYEVDSYIIKETIILTIIGIILGLISGLYLCYFIISSCETDNLMFLRNIEVPSYVISTIITISFTLLVNILTHFNLKKIDMIDSLKNVE